jgi:hypothetical protein
MKRTFIVALAAVFSFSFCSCGKNETNKVIKPNMVAPYNYSEYVNISNDDYREIKQDERKASEKSGAEIPTQELNKKDAQFYAIKIGYIVLGSILLTFTCVSVLDGHFYVASAGVYGVVAVHMKIKELLSEYKN